MKGWILSLCLLIAAPVSLLQAEEMVVLYFKRPPYYDTVNGQATGFLVELTRKIFSHADIIPLFREVPPSRILRYIQNPGLPVCSMGWFKNKEREAYAKFSQAIYQDKPLVLLTTRAMGERLNAYATLKAVFSDPSLILAKIDAFSYGAIIDGWMARYAPTRHEVSSNQSLLPRVIFSNRASYMLVAPEEIDLMLKDADLNPGEFVSLAKPDIPAGNKRYIIFNQSVDNSVIEKIDQAIKAVLGSGESLDVHL